MDINALAAPFPPERVSWRVGSTTSDKKRGMVLAYIDARDVQDRLNEVCGPFGWQCRHEMGHDKRLTCHIGIRSDDGDWVWKSDGAGETDYEGEKGSYSDSFKRAAVKWGIGRYLYDVPPPWVAIEAAGKSFKIADSERGKLIAVLKGSAPVELDADKYVEGALSIIATMPSSTAATEWWKAQAEKRRAHGLTQGHVDVLKRAMAERFKDKEAA